MHCCYGCHNITFLNMQPIGGLSILIHRESYMSAHVLLNLLNKLRKRDQMRGLPSILSIFCNEFNKFNYTGAQMLNSIYQKH